MPQSSTQQNTPARPHARKRVLVVSQHYWPETFRINDIVDGLIEQGIEVDVLCGLPNYPKGEWFEGYSYTSPRRQQHRGAEIFRSGEIRRRGNTSLRIFLNYCSFPVFALFSLPRLSGRRYNAVFSYETSPVLQMLPAIVYAKLHRVPLCTYVLDLWPDNLYSVLPVKNAALRRIAHGVSAWFYRRSTSLIALSDDVAKTLALMTTKAKKQPCITVIPQYAEDFYATPIQNEALAERFSGRFNILFAGNISPAQDLENLVRAIKIVRQSQGGEAVRVIVLGDGMSREALQSFCTQQGVRDAFEFCGSVPAQEIPQWTAFADVLFAGLAKSENLGGTLPAKIPSYLAAAKPLLVADDGEGARVAGSCGAALTSPAGNSEALAKNIMQFVSMPKEQREQMGKNGFNCYKQNYSRTMLLTALTNFMLEGN